MPTATKTPAKKSAATKASAKTDAKKSTKKAPAKKPSSAQTCWPGFEPTPGKAAGEKGSCQPKEHQTADEKKGDSRAAAASKREKSGK